MTQTFSLPVPEEDATLNHKLVDKLSEGVILLTRAGRLHYANRAALSMHGAQSLAALGGDAAGYRELFRLVDLDGVALPAGSYPLDQLMRAQRLTGLRAKVFFGDQERVFSYRGEGEGDSAAVLFIQDITAKHDAQRRFETAFSANPAPALISRLSDLRYVKVDRSFLEMTGFKREEVIGRTAYEFDVFAGAQERDQVLGQFHRGEAIKPTESYLATQAGDKKFVIVGGQPLEINDEPCMLLTFVDIDERKRMENALRQSEARFAKIFNLAPVAAAMSFSGEDRFFDVNRAFRTLTGYGDEDVLGRTGAELGLWSQEGEQAMSMAREQRPHHRDVEVELRTKHGAEHTVQVSAETLLIDEQACVLRMFHDVTEWKRTENELKGAINQVMSEPNWFSASVAHKIMGVRTQSAEARAKLGQLTRREQQAFVLSAKGLDNSAVAHELGVAKNTVRNYVASLYRKLDVHSRAELMVWAKNNGVTS